VSFETGDRIDLDALHTFFLLSIEAGMLKR
jgi:hypothetical protein